MAEIAGRGWRDVRRVLAVRLDNLGDVLMTTPALAALRSLAPDVRITLLASSAGTALAGLLPDVDDIIEFPAPWVKSAAADAMQPGLRELRLVETLAARRFDAAVIFTVCTQSALPAALLCRMAGIRLRLAHSRENPYALLTHWVVETDHVEDGMRHEVARQLALVLSVGASVADDRLRITTSPADVARARARRAGIGLAPADPYVVVHPGASAPSRRWPPERFGAAADAIARATGCAIVFTGGADEAALIDVARAAMSVESASLAGQLDVGGLAALIADSRLLVSNNSGPAHLAAAVGTPVVVLYALTNPQHTPWKVPSRVLSHNVPCRWCLKSVCPMGHHACLEGVTVETVVEAALALLETSAATRTAASAVLQEPRA